MNFSSWIFAACLAAAGQPQGPHGDAGIEPRGDLLFCSAQDGDFEIYRMDLPSKGILPLTANGAQDLDPCWTADGKEIVFVSNRAGKYSLYMMEADGTGVRPLHREPGAIRRPAVSPDGKWIAFTVFDQGEPEPGEGKVPPFGRIRLYNRATRRTVAVSPAGWSSDDVCFDAQGRGLLFTAVDKGPALIRISLSGMGVLGEPEIVLESDKPLASPQATVSGDRILHIRGGAALWLAGKKSSPAFPGVRGKIRKAALGPSGPAVLAVKAGGQYDLWLVSSPGAEPSRLTSHPADDLAPSIK